MKVVILCGGFGTRIRDVSDDIPKGMIPIGGYPILWHIMKYYSHFGHQQFVLCLGHKSDVIKDFFLNYEAHTQDFTINLGATKSITYHSRHAEANWQVTLAETGERSMTGARIKRIQRYVAEEENFMLTYGDGLSNVNLNKLVGFHKEHKKALTISGVRPPSRFGELMCDGSGLVTEFNEKPQATGGLISGGFFVCNQKLFEALDDREDLVFEQEPIRYLVSTNQAMVYNHDGFFQPMDTARDHKLLTGLYNKNEAPWVVW